MSSRVLTFQRLPAPSAMFPRLPDQVQIEHGPPALLGRAILKADNAARRRGVTLSVASCADLVPVNKANADTWKPLATIFHPDLGGNTDKDSFAIIGRTDGGDIIATQAARFFDWQDTTFHDEAESLRLFYGQPARDKLKNERCIVLATQARRITGKIVYSGGGWYRPDFRGRQLSAILPRVSRVLSYTRWLQDFTISIMAEPVFRGGFWRRAGYTYSEPGVQTIGSPVSDGAIDYRLIWMESSQLLDDLEWFVSSFDTEVDGRIDDRQADELRHVSVHSKR